MRAVATRAAGPCTPRKRRSRVNRAVLQLFAANEPGFHAETYDPNSLVRRTNWLLRSEEFDNTSAWPRVLSSVVANAEGTADKLVDTTDVAFHYIRQINAVSAGSRGVAVVRAKAAGRDWIAVAVGGGEVYFNIATGAVGTQTGATGSIAAATDDPGYFDCTVIVANCAHSAVDIALANGNSGKNYAGDGVSGVLLRRAQANRNVSASLPYQKVTDWTTEYMAAALDRIGMWQDAAGTTPVTGVEQPVGRWNDLSGNGNHATQSTANSRPVLSARYNLLTKTEQFDDAAWTKRGTATATAATAPDGTGQTITVGASGVNDFYQFVTTSASALLTPTVQIWPIDVAGTLVLGNPSTPVLGNWSINLALLTPGQWNTINTSHPAVSVTAAFKANGSGQAGLHFSAASGTLSFYLKKTDLRTANDAALDQPAYQRVNTSTDYDTEGFIHYLKFDGLDDSLQTPSIDFSGRDKATVWAGVTKLNDVAAGIVAEFGINTHTDIGSFYLAAPETAGNFSFRAGGSLRPSPAIAAGYPSPVCAILTATSSISDNVSAVRVDGALKASQTASHGIGNFGNWSLNIGRRNNTVVPFNGRITSLTVRGSTTPTSEAFIAQMNQYATEKAGKTIAA